MPHSSTDSPADTPATQTALNTWRDLFHGHNLTVVVVMALGVLLYAMNLFFTAALMPSIVGDIGGERVYAWVTTVFVMVAIIASLLVSRLLEWKGVAGGYVLAFVIFGLGTAGTAASPTMSLLIAGRAAQGLGGGFLVGLGYAVVRVALPERHWARGIGLISGMWGIGTLLGPVLGGLFATFNLWRPAFWILTIVSALLAVIAKKSFSGLQSHNKTEPLPWLSVLPLLLAITIISISNILPTTGQTLAALLLGLFFLLVFFIAEQRSAFTLLPKSTYQRGNTLKWVYLTVAALSAGVTLENFIPLYGQQLAGLSPLMAGILGGAMSLGWNSSQFFVVSVRETTARRVIQLGPIIFSLSILAYGFLQIGQASTLIIAGWFIALFISGIGVGITWPPLGVAAMSGSAEEGGKAAASISTTQLMTYAICSAVIGTLMALGGQDHAVAARYATLGIGILALFGIVAAYFATRKPVHR